jgi:hypothetical protein
MLMPRSCRKKGTELLEGPSSLKFADYVQGRSRILQFICIDTLLRTQHYFNCAEAEFCIIVRVRQLPASSFPKIHGGVTSKTKLYEDETRFEKLGKNDVKNIEHLF